MKAFTLTAIVLSVLSARATTILTPANWNTATNGSIGSTLFTVSGLSAPSLGIGANETFGGPNYSVPLTNAYLIQYGSGNDWTATFGSTLPDLYLYAYLWRGDYTTQIQPDPVTHYTFSQSFTIVSGFAGATVSGNTLACPPGLGTAGGFYYGILRFSGPINTLSVVSDGFIDGAGQDMTFASSVPEPSIPALFGVGTLLVAGRRIGCRQVIQRIMSCLYAALWDKNYWRNVDNGRDARATVGIDQNSDVKAKTAIGRTAKSASTNRTTSFIGQAL